jgi:hypothetical protein
VLVHSLHMQHKGSLGDTVAHLVLHLFPARFRFDNIVCSGAILKNVSRSLANVRHSLTRVKPCALVLGVALVIRGELLRLVVYVASFSSATGLPIC